MHAVKESDGSSNASEGDISDEWPIYTMKSEGREEVKVSINTYPIEMELDTGSSVSLIPEKLFESKFIESMPLKRSSVTLRTYTGERVPVLAEAEVQVEYESQIMKLSC